MSRPKKPRSQFLQAFSRSLHELAIERFEMHCNGIQDLSTLALAEVTHAYGAQAMYGARRAHVNMRGRLAVAAELATAQAEARFDAARAITGACLTVEQVL